MNEEVLERQERKWSKKILFVVAVFVLVWFDVFYCCCCCCCFAFVCLLPYFDLFPFVMGRSCKAEMWGRYGGTGKRAEFGCMIWNSQRVIKKVKLNKKWSDTKYEVWNSMVCESPLSVPLATSAGYVWCSFAVTQDNVGLFFLHPFLLVINAFLVLAYSDFLIYYFVTHWEKQTITYVISRALWVLALPLLNSSCICLFHIRLIIAICR